MTTGVRAIIIGAGIGGLTAAIALRQVGLAVTIYERAPELQEVGAGIALAANAMKALARLGLAEQVAAAGAALAGGVIKTPRGAELVKIPAASRSLITFCVHRGALQRVLRGALPRECLRLGQECEGLAQDGNRVRASFANGDTADGDFLVGADGLHSAARAAIHGWENPRYAGYTAWRGVATFAMDFMASETLGRGQRFGVAPLGDGRVYWFATKNVPAGTPDAPDGRKQELLRLFKGWHEPIETVIQSTDPAAILRHDIYDRRPLPLPWGAGLVTLLGDAAHPTTPNLGQGACQAMEDAVVLAQALQEAADLPAALRRYEGQRAPRTAYITNLSRRVGVIGQLENPIACWLRNAALRATPVAFQLKQLEKAQIFVPGR